ncbi:MAG: metallophosphoesterase [Candidatus Bathyarchaeota archaeon]|nr:metallophosphoesterase [Candidatus Bathyarchaeota archaeon]
MGINLASIINESLAVQSRDFLKIVESAISLLREECGRFRRFTVLERLVKLDPIGEALVIGDLHGDLSSLRLILESSVFLEKMAKNADAVLIFLGDYGDRGAYSAEVYYTVLRLKLAFPEQIMLLRGNHEGPADLLASPHDLPMQFQLRFKEHWRVVYSKVRELFGYLYNAVLVEDCYLMVHGGLPAGIRSIQDLALAHKLYSEHQFLEDLLWSDPVDEVNGVLYSPRGAGKLFGKDVTEEVLNKMGVRVLIRGHEPCQEGFKLNHDGKVLTLFSRKGAPYFNAHGAYLRLPLSEKIRSAQQLLPWIHKF